MLLPIFACLFNCAPTVVVSVEAHAIAAPVAGTQVLLMPADPRIPSTDPTYAYLSKMLTQVLTKKGLRPVSTAGDAQAVVVIGWRRGDPKVTEHVIDNGYDLPAFDNQQAAIGGTFHDVEGASSLADTLNPGIRDAHAPTIMKTTIYPWIIELRGSAQSPASAPPTWTVTMTASTDKPTEDPAGIAPEMVAAGAPFIGSDSKRKDVRISASDAAVKSILEDGAKAASGK